MKLMDKLRFLREARSWTKKAAANKVGIPYTTYVEYEDKKRQCNPTGRKVQALAKAFGVSADYLFDETKGYPPGPEDLITSHAQGTSTLTYPAPTWEGNTGETVPGSNRVNIIGLVSAGETEIAYDDAGLPVGGSIEDPIERPYDVKDPNTYGLVIEGDSMLPGYPKGTKVIVCPSDNIKTGDIVICSLRSTGKVYIKEIKHQGDMIILSSHNTANYPPMAVPYKDVLFCHKVVWARRP
jgi:phage repressor protein C with HTH and peptisase S24 domain